MILAILRDPVDLDIMLMGNSHACILGEPEVVVFLKKFDYHVSDMIAMTVYTFKDFLRFPVSL